MTATRATVLLLLASWCLTACHTAGPALPPASPGLGGTSWKLIQFQGGDGQVLRPRNGTDYTLAFDATGNVNVRLDCNRGRGAWKSSGGGDLQLGPLAITRAMCPPGSLHDQIARQWPAIRSYVIRNGHLFLALMADWGTYEFEPG
jgi:para-nitrobenzyl esterase